MLSPWVALTLKPKFWFALILTLVVFTLLIKLGFWQMGRGEQKLDYEKALAQRATMAPEPLDTLLKKANGISPNLGQEYLSDAQQSLTGAKVKMDVMPVSHRTFLLDNQVWNGQVGYLMLQPVKVTSGYQGNGRYVLLELGFVKAGHDRRILPSFTELTQPVSLEGRVYQKQSNPVSDKLHAESGWPKRIQNLNLEALEGELGLPLLPFVIQPSNLNLEYPQPWHPVPMSSQKHFGYALQWFSMALVFALIMALVLLRALNIRLIPKGENDDSSKHG
ncbi:SURF1 family protein [Vibrio penaeicida]|uniref:SURF1-like protein n=1 Tax=Vibrio penaeicida TaxID=104609 RepID=A0AAV5NZM3_9VIBR|nr:SURF1 family protein [Vibrio penaeicida]RTZ23704.1 SURF1 family protein [Vibrio penaeicida]GLQ75798.1 SURF1-like protein [Vibrio penaeicida]